GDILWDPELRRPRAGRGSDADGQPRRRHLRAGSDLLSDAGRAPSVPGGDGPPDIGTGQDDRPSAALAAAAGSTLGCGDDRPEMPSQGPEAPLRRCRGSGGGPGSILGWAANPGPADRGRRALLEVGPAPAGGGLACRGRLGGYSPWLRPSRLAM